MNALVYAPPEEDSKTCTKCGEVKLRSEMVRDPSKREGIRSHCRSCENARTRAWRKAHPESAAESTRKWYAANKERKNETNRRWKAANPERVRERDRRYRDIGPIKRKARAAVSNAIIAGRMVRPSACEVCGTTEHVEMHHWSYCPEDWLDVRPLCKTHHAAWHRSNVAKMPSP